ncbi:MAG UNVERIFIED_CONTAM: hypothetical protein LVR18_47885 [Planctomycetaceae bacterium]
MVHLREDWATETRGGGESAIQTLEKRRPLVFFEVTIPATQCPVTARDSTLQALTVRPLRFPADRVTQSLYAFLTWKTL